MLYDYQESEVLSANEIFDKIVEPYRELSNLRKDYISDWKMQLCFSLAKVMPGKNVKVHQHPFFARSGRPAYRTRIAWSVCLHELGALVNFYRPVD
jgi:hypothetical protein